MAKRRESKRRGKPAKRQARKEKGPGGQRQSPVRHRMPSAQTMWRIMQLTIDVPDDLLRSMQNLQPALWLRDANAVRTIEQAADIEEVLDLAVTATGLAGWAWPRRMRAFGPDAADNIVARLNSDWMRSHAKDRAGLQERYLGALRWCGDRAADGLASCWDALDDYGRSLACIVFGLLGARQAADRIWAFYEQTRAHPEGLLVGPLWGLIDLGDARAADALADVVGQERLLYETFGFLSRAGDRRAVVPLASEVLVGPDDRKADAMWALTGVGYRVGRDIIAQELLGDVGTEETQRQQVEAFLDRLFHYSQADVESHFEAFYATTATGLLSIAKGPRQQH
jgi:hypothetical protein